MIEPQFDTPKEVEHVWNYILPLPGGCWRWTGGTDNHGYARLGLHIPGIRPQPLRTVRPVIYELATGLKYDIRTQRIFNVCGDQLCVRYHPEHNEIRELQSVSAKAAREEALTASTCK